MFDRKRNYGVRKEAERPEYSVLPSSASVAVPCYWEKLTCGTLEAEAYGGCKCYGAQKEAREFQLNI